MKFLIKEQLDLINRHFLACLQGAPVSKINQGHCYRWAYLAHTLHGAKLYSNYYHAFIKIEDHFYDAEMIHGVKSWRSLPFFQKHKKCTTKVECHKDIIDFSKSWGLDLEKENNLKGLLEKIKSDQNYTSLEKNVNSWL